MKVPRLDDLHLALRASALGSFSAAAREAGLLPGQVSAAVQRLERELGWRLFARSTRSLRLTADGERYLPHAQAALDALRAGEDPLQGPAGALQGVLQVAAPSDFGRNVLLPWLVEFRARHPGIELRLQLSDRVADVFRDPVDVALRYGVQADASFVALPLAPANRRVLCAAPAYLARRGAPAEVADLARHECLCYRMAGQVHERWAFHTPQGRQGVRVRGAWISDDADVARRLALAGEGIVYKSALDLADDLLAGRLVRLLPQVDGEPAPLSMVLPHRGQFSPSAQALHAWLQGRCDALARTLGALA